MQQIQPLIRVQQRADPLPPHSQALLQRAPSRPSMRACTMSVPLPLAWSHPSPVHPTRRPTHGLPTTTPQPTMPPARVPRLCSAPPHNRDRCHSQHHLHLLVTHRRPLCLPLHGSEGRRTGHSNRCRCCRRRRGKSRQRVEWEGPLLQARGGSYVIHNWSANNTL